MTHQERADRRVKIRQEVEAGASPGTVATEYGVTIETVQKALRQGPNYRPPTRTLSDPTYQVIGALCRPNANCSEIATRFGVTRQWVLQIANRCRNADIPVTVRKNGRGGTNGKT